tara:strand:+ start:7417 stop:7914 length:498 start_codon:yes stop_codon:yes gene_type:complete
MSDFGRGGLIYNINLDGTREYSHAFLGRYGKFLYSAANILFSINEEDIVSNKRWSEIVVVRKTISNSLSVGYGLHPETIGDFLCIDRSTAIHNSKKHYDWMEYDKRYLGVYDKYFNYIDKVIIEDDLKKATSLQFVEKSKDQVIKNLKKELTLLKQKVYDNETVN